MHGTLSPQQLALAAQVVTGLSLVITTLLAVRLSPRSGITAAIVLVALLLFGQTVLSVPPEAIPATWLLPLQEGTTDTLLATARGGGGHVGWVWDTWLAGAVTQGVRRLDAVVLYGVAAAAVATALLAGLLLRVLHSPLVVAALMVAWTWSVPVRWAAWSEAPASTIWLAELGLWVCWLACTRREGLDRLGAGVGMLGWTLVLSGLRTELAGLGVLALLTAIIGVTGLGHRLEAAIMPRLRATGAALRTHPGRVAGLLLAGVVVVGLAYEALLPGHVAIGTGSWLIAVVHPLFPSPLAWPALLMATWPVGVVLLLIAGLGHGLRHPVRTGGLAVATIVLLRLYLSAAHGGFFGRTGDVAVFETVRYQGLIAPLLLGGAAWGWHSLHTGGHTRIASVLLGLCLVPPLPPAARLWPKSTAARQGTAGFGVFTPVARDAQLEVRFLTSLLREHGRCGFVVATAPHTYTAFRGPDTPRDPQRGRALLSPYDEAVASLADAPCVVQVHGHACGLSQTCTAPDAPMLSRVAVTAPAYAHPDHHWTASDLVLKAWLLR